MASGIYTEVLQEKEGFTLQRVAQKLSGYDKGEIRSYREVKRLSKYIYHCKKCRKLIRVRENIDKVNDLLRKHFCRFCQHELFVSKRRAKDEINDAEKISQEKIKEIAQERGFKEEDIRREIKTLISTRRAEFDGLSQIEQRTGSAIIITKEELMEGMMLELIEKHNKEELEKLEKPTSSGNQYPKPNDDTDDDLNDFCQNVYYDRLHQEELIQQEVQEKGW